MRKYLLLLMLFLPFLSYSQGNDSVWTKELRLQQLNNIQDSTTWDMPRMMKDNEPSPFGNPGFMQYGAFPVAHYKLLGENSFKGLGTFSTVLQPIPLLKKEIIYTSFTVNESPFYDTKSGKDKVFFTLIMVTDTVDLKNYSTARFQVVSRNHPDYIGQGYVKTKNDQIDFLAFITPEGNEYAIINMRIFNLNYGSIILVAPQKDGTLRSMQLHEEEISSEKLDTFIKKDILKRNEVIEFFTNEGVI